MKLLRHNVSAASAAAFAAGLLFATAPAAQAVSKVTVSPGNPLTSGATVRVTAEGLVPGQTYRVGVCDATGQFGPPACDSETGFSAYFTANNSTQTVSFKARKQFKTAPSRSHPSGKTVSCKGGASATQCFMVVAQHGGTYANNNTPVTFR